MISIDGESVGDLRSAVRSPRYGRGVGLAMLDRDAWDIGTAVTVESPIGPIPATVASMPFTDPE
jgi:glycine cleavage system aminomethyltransferase T